MTLANVRANPFYQAPRQWQIRVYIGRHEVPAIEEAFGDLALAILSFEINEAQAEWYVDVITDVSPDNADIHGRLALVSGMLGIATPRCEIHVLEPKDWVSEVEQSFSPLNIGRFYVHGSHVRSGVPQGKIALKINAGAAFGSGEHATTSGCLLALSLLAKRRRFLHPLDMGCGSGILAIAAAKLWHCKVVGVDIDPFSVLVARENVRLNREHTLVNLTAGDGYRAEVVRRNGPFDLILANILARPLIRMAPFLAENLAPGGVAVLSGLLDFQERMVLAAHRMQGLKLLTRIRRNGWHTLIIGKSR